MKPYKPAGCGRLFARGRMVKGRLQVFFRLPLSTVPWYALKRGKGVNPLQREGGGQP